MRSRSQGGNARQAMPGGMVRWKIQEVFRGDERHRQLNSGIINPASHFLKYCQQTIQYD
ncbi:hypothetical protein Bsp3421_002474 [Burkholderia sp. FERM BP-3421]|jgi:hypothetical protein|uniref:hypothetical protein n=1 Tax=Burkholderia sp. FERM BP-3421 TaxID=1494466 RepID=UPI00235EF93F|nr:hypothetical protein [Burkholderia sp. FERM BP-3421]WDD92467.1 hypothetical protein Bsp3421_002474 [Burkholderia sp. FERM BP-3421]